MTSQTETHTPHKLTDSKGWASGALLIAIGTFLLIAQFVRAEWVAWLVLPGLGGLFLLAGLATRSPGLLVPGGILSGIGFGSWLITAGPYGAVAEEAQGGVFLLAFAAGWALITVLSLVTRRALWWPLIPGVILAAIGGALLLGGAAITVLEWAGRLWPLALIAGGAAIILKRRSA